MILDEIQCAGSVEVEVGVEKTTAGFDVCSKFSMEARFGGQSKKDRLGLASVAITGFKHTVNLVKQVHL